MAELALGWTMQVDRGPDWLYVRLRSSHNSHVGEDEVSDQLWSLLEKHFTYRLVLELDTLPRLPDELIHQLAALHDRIHSQDGLLRLCGLSESDQQTLHSSDAGAKLTHYRNREEAVMGFRPGQPR